MSKDVRIIKRYQNRKLYDTYQSCYVTLEEISQIIREGNEIQVIDNKTKNDITYMTQIQLLFDQEKKSNTIQNGDTELLKRVIRAKEGTLTGYIKMLEAEKGPLQDAVDHEEHRLQEETQMPSPSLENMVQRSEINTQTIETSSTLN